MDSLASGENLQAAANQLAPLTPIGLGFAIDAIGIALGFIGIIAISLRLYVRFGFSAGLSRSLGPDDVLAVLGTVSCPFPTANLPTEKTRSLGTWNEIDKRMSTSSHSRLRLCLPSMPPDTASAHETRTFLRHFIGSELPNIWFTGRFCTLCRPA